MDLRKFPAVKDISEQEIMSLWWYQPYIFSDDIVTGIPPQWFMKGIDQSIVKRSELGRKFNRFWDLSTRTAKMYEDWSIALTEMSHVDLSQASAFEIGCNTGSMLFSLKERGVETCVGIDRSSEVARQRTILRDITGIHGVDFRSGGWSSESHSIQGLQDSEQFDLVICTAVAQHISDPLHLIRELASRTKKALLLHTWAGTFNMGMTIRYMPAAHHEKWGDVFPNQFDTQVSKKLLKYSLKECGFKEVIQLQYSRKWLPWSWYRGFSTVVCLK